MAVKDEHRYLVGELVKLKYENDPRTLKDCHTYLDELLVLEVAELTLERLTEHAKKLLNQEILYRGSVKTGKGVKKKPSPTTVLRKFAYLSAAIGHANKALGTNLPQENVLRTIARLREMK